MSQQTTKHKYIRSLRVAHELMRRGFRPIDSQPSIKSPGYTVFVFAQSLALLMHLAEIMDDIAGEKVRTAPG